MSKITIYIHIETSRYFLKSNTNMKKPCFVVLAMRPGAPGRTAKAHQETGIGCSNTRIDLAFVVGRKDAVRPNGRVDVVDIVLPGGPLSERIHAVGSGLVAEGVERKLFPID